MKSEIHRIELPTVFGMKTVNSYLMKGVENVLIDCGENTDPSFQSLENGLNAHGLNFKDIDRIVISHAHVDHIGMANRVAEASDCPVWVSEKVLPWAVDPIGMWEKRKSIMIPTFLRLYPSTMHQTVEEGYFKIMKSFQKVWEPIDSERIIGFDSEGRLDLLGESWQVLYLPGHSITQSAFYTEDTEDFLSADMLLRITPTPVVEPDPANPGKRNKGILEMIDSYVRVRQLNIQTVYPGHYEIFHNAHAVIDNQLLRIDQRAAECLSLIKSGLSSFFDIYMKMYKGQIIMPALVMLIGYLDLLNSRGLVFEKEEDGYIQFYPI